MSAVKRGNGAHDLNMPSRRHIGASPLLFSAIAILAWLSVNIVYAQSLANSFFTEPDVHPGFVCRVGSRAFTLFGDYLRQRVDKFIKFDALQFNQTVGLTPLVRLSISSSNLLNFDSAGFQSRFAVNAGQDIVWTGSNIRVTVNALYRLTGGSGEMTGQVPITFDRSKVQLEMTAGVNADGHLKTDLQRCRVTVGELRADFTPTDTELLRSYLPLIHRAVSEQADSFLCPTFSAELMPVVANRLLNSPMSAALFDYYFINYGLVGPIGYDGDVAIDLRHRGNVFGILRQGRTRLNDFRLPFRSAPLVSSVEAQKQHMVTFQFSNYTLASLLFWMDQYRKFDYEISQKSINDSNIAGYLRTECDKKDVCAGTLFPALGKSFPSSVVSIRTHTVTFPHVRLENGKAFVIIDSRIDAFVTAVDAHGTEREAARRFLTASMLAELTVTKATFHDYTLRGQLTMDSFNISGVQSLVEGIDAGSIEFLINALNELIIADDMAKKLKDGIKLPILFDFEQSHSEVHFERDRMWIGADFCFDDNCKRAAAGGRVAGADDAPNGKQLGQSTDMDVNYYDAAG